MPGFGAQPAAGSNAGVGSPPTAPEQPGKLLTDHLGASTGARKIDPRTRDYVLSADTGRLEGMPATRQVVHLAVQTEKFSSCVAELGQQLRDIDRVTSNIVARCLATLTEALEPAVSQGLVQVVGFSTFKAGPADGLREGRTYGRLRWKDLTTGAEYEERV